MFPNTQNPIKMEIHITKDQLKLARMGLNMVQTRLADQRNACNYAIDKSKGMDPLIEKHLCDKLRETNEVIEIFNKMLDTRDKAISFTILL